MNTTRFNGFGDTTPTYFGEPVDCGDLCAAATGADDELSQTEQRRQDRPRLTIEFSDDSARQQFLNELIGELKHPSTDRKPVWRHVALWTTGGSLR